MIDVSISGIDIAIIAAYFVVVPTTGLLAAKQAEEKLSQGL